MAAAGGLLWTVMSERGQGLLRPVPTPQPQATAPAAAAVPVPGIAAPAVTPEARPDAPRFDVARVGARGMLVTAGRAAPGAEVVLLEAGREIGRTRADARGEWVILPGEALAPGLRELALTARRAGEDPVPAQETVLLIVPAPPAALAERPEPGAGGQLAAEAAGPAPDGALPGAGAAGSAEAASAQARALLLPPTSGPAAAPRLLQGEAPAGDPARRRLELDVVDYDEAGGMRFAGSAAPGARVRVYVGSEHAGDAVADASGRWQLAPEHQPPVGRHTLRVDQLADAGTVAARIEVPFQRDRIEDGAVVDGRTVVQPGSNLWRIARRVYGRGVRYTVIYQANKNQIRDPRWIYPGQVFQVPDAPIAATPTSAVPPSASRSR